MISQDFEVFKWEVGFYDPRDVCHRTDETRVSVLGEK